MSALSDGQAMLEEAFDSLGDAGREVWAWWKASTPDGDLALLAQAVHHIATMSATAMLLEMDPHAEAREARIDALVAERAELRAALARASVLLDTARCDLHNKALKRSWAATRSAWRRRAAALLNEEVRDGSD